MYAMRLAGLSHNELAALRIIQERGQATRADVASAIGLSMAMAARLVGRLLAAGLAREAGRSTGAGPGRQALLLEMVPDAAYFVGVDIGTEIVHILVSDLQGAVRAYREVPSALFAGRMHDEIVAVLVALIQEAIGSAAIPPTGVASIGVSVTGIIDSERGVCIVRSHTPGWEHFPVATALRDALGIPVVMDETARAKAVAEMRLGVARGLRHFLYVDAGTAIGAGIVIDGRPYRGIGGLAGELGHVTVDPAGALCRCGNRGCIQATASARALVAEARNLLRQGVYSSLTDHGDNGEELTIASIAAAAAGGDKLSLGLLTEAGERLGEAISMALNLLGMDRVVVGGTLVHYSPIILEAAARVVQLRVLPMVPHRRSLVASTLGSSAAAHGIVLQAIDHALDEALAPIAPDGASRTDLGDPNATERVSAGTTAMRLTDRVASC